VSGERRVVFVFLGLMLGNGLAALDTTLVATALPTIVGDLGGLRDLSWVATAYMLTSLACMPLYGKLGDLYGRKRIFLIAIVIFLTGSVLCGLAQSMTQLIACRAVQGIGAAGLVALPMAMLGDLFPARDLGRWLGYAGFVFAFSSVAGPLFGGLFSQHLSWRWAFLVNVPLGIISFAIVARGLHLPPRRTEHRIDWPGVFLLVGAVTCVVFVASWGGSREAWDSPLILVLGSATVCFTIALVAWERRAPEPIFPPRLFRISIARVTLILNLLIGLLFFAALYFLSAFLQFVDGVSPTDSGLYLIPLMGSAVCATVLVGRLVVRTGRYRKYPIIGGFVGLAGTLMLVRLDDASAPFEVMLGAAVLGFGLGLSMQVLILAIQNAVEPRDLGVATSTSMFTRQLGGALGLALLGSVFNTQLAHWVAQLVPARAHLDAARLRGRPETLADLSPAVRDVVAEAFARSLHTVFLWCIPVAVAALVLAFFLRQLPLREHVGEQVVENVGDDLAVALEGAVVP
jgi:EmrB/QacA subfamily drug resistance transporter